MHFSSSFLCPCCCELKRAHPPISGQSSCQAWWAGPWIVTLWLTSARSGSPRVMSVDREALRAAASFIMALCSLCQSDTHQARWHSAVTPLLSVKRQYQLLSWDSTQWPHEAPTQRLLSEEKTPGITVSWSNTRTAESLPSRNWERHPLRDGENKGRGINCWAKLMFLLWKI